jgi:hypothetical protein
MANFALIWQTKGRMRITIEILCCNGSRFFGEVTVLFDVCRMNPSMGLAVRARAVELCRMPSLAILLTLEHAHNNPEGMF